MILPMCARDWTLSKSSYIEQLKTISVGTLTPDLTIILDLNAGTGCKRAETDSQAPDRIEAESSSFEKVGAI